MAKKKKPNIGKAIKRATKATNKAVVKPATKVASKVAKGAATVAKVTGVTAALSAVNKAIFKPAVAKVTKSSESKYKKKASDCERQSNMQKTEITNLKYQITTAEKEKADYISRINTMNGTITNLNNQIGTLNKQVNTLDNRINSSLVATEGFSGSFTVIEGFPQNVEKVNRSDKYKDYDIQKSGLLAASNEYKRLYGNYYAGYQDNETMIQDELKPQIDYLSKTDLDGMQYSYVALKQQNKTLESQIEDTVDEYSTDFQRAKYVEQEITSVKKRNSYLFFGFYLLFFIFAYALFSGSDLSIRMKAVILLFVFVYPYLIGHISRIVLFIYKYIVALFRGIPVE